MWRRSARHEVAPSGGSSGPSQIRKKRTNIGPREILLLAASLTLGIYCIFMKKILAGQDLGVKRGLERRYDNQTMVVLVLSRRNGFDRREAIRETWAKDRSNVYFIVGDHDCAVPNHLRVGEIENLKWQFHRGRPRRRRAESSPRGRNRERKSDAGVGEKENEKVTLGCADEHGRRIAADMNEEEHPPLLGEERNEWETTVAGNKKIAEKLMNERVKYGDILIATDVVDTYHSLPAKLKYGYRWAIENLPHAKWFVKSDDDTFVRVEELSHYLETAFREEIAAVDPLVNPAVIGEIRTKNSPDKAGKWKEFPEFKRKLYPPFPLGSYGHIVSRPVAKYVADNAEKLFEYQGEDVSLGIWLDESPLNGITDFIDGTHFMNNVQNCMVQHMFVIGHDLDPNWMGICQRLGEKRSGYHLLPVGHDRHPRGMRMHQRIGEKRSGYRLPPVGHDRNPRGMRMHQRIGEKRSGYHLPPPPRVVVGPGAPRSQGRNWRSGRQIRPPRMPGGWKPDMRTNKTDWEEWGW
mmetsp:Transcript_5745/g.12125  ORF Transcript_5745/g.12125 Transcript_5745/m.12125 type:complete len:521 (-) Transcript_5745:70-1632(-)